MKIPFFIVDAFTDTPYQGNPAGFFVEDNAGWSDAERMQLCAEFSLESAFLVEGDEECNFHLRYYTGVTEVPFCGHATVAALTAMATQKIGEGHPLIGEAEHQGSADSVTLRVGTQAGVLPVTVKWREEGVSVTLHQRPGAFGAALSVEEASAVKKALGGAGIRDDLPVQMVSTGSPWLLYPAADRASVDGIDPKTISDAVMEVSRRHQVLGVYVFAIEEDNGAPAIWSRCFCPLAGLPEDPVTGSASGTLGCYLAEHGVLKIPENSAAEFLARQGFAGGRGGTAHIHVVSEEGKWRAAVTGTAVVIAQGTIFKHCV